MLDPKPKGVALVELGKVGPILQRPPCWIVVGHKRLKGLGALARFIVPPNDYGARVVIFGTERFPPTLHTAGGGKPEFGAEPRP